MAWHCLTLLVYNFSTLSIFIIRSLNLFFFFFSAFISFSPSQPIHVFILCVPENVRIWLNLIWGTAESNWQMTTLSLIELPNVHLQLTRFSVFHIFAWENNEGVWVKTSSRKSLTSCNKQKQSQTNICSESKINRATSLSGISTTFSSSWVLVFKLAKVDTSSFANYMNWGWVGRWGRGAERVTKQQWPS